MILNISILPLKYENKIYFIFFKNILRYTYMIFMIKHLIAIIILMAGTFTIGYWFGKNSKSVKNLFKKFIKQN